MANVGAGRNARKSIENYVDGEFWLLFVLDCLSLECPKINIWYYVIPH